MSLRLRRGELRLNAARARWNGSRAGGGRGAGEAVADVVDGADVARGDADHRGEVVRVPQPVHVGLAHAAPAAQDLLPDPRIVDVHDRLRRARAEHGLAVALDHRELTDADAAEDGHGEGASDHAGCGWTGTPLSFSATAWP